MTLLDRSLSLLKTNRVTIQYVANGETLEWKVRPGISRIEQYVEGESTLVSRLQDFIGLASELVYQGAALTPERGHTIEWGRNGVIDVFEVLPANGEDWYEPVDAYGKWIRVHTKLVDTREG